MDVRFGRRALLGGASLLLSRCLLQPTCTIWNSRDSINQAQARFWENYKRNFLVDLPRGTIVVASDQDGYTPSEAMGHAMFFAAEREDFPTLNKLIDGLSYFQKPNGLYRWRINANGSVRPGTDEGSATESEHNIANALFLAYERTGNEQYLRLGRELLNNLWMNATTEFQGRRLLLPWPPDGRENNCTSTPNGLVCPPGYQIIFATSYFSPEHARRFARYDNNPLHDWDKVSRDWYEIMNQVLDAAVLEPQRFGRRDINPMPDFVRLVPAGDHDIIVQDFHPVLGTGEGEWSADIIRIPLYVAMDDHRDARFFLERFCRAMGSRNPDDITVGSGIRSSLSSLTYVAIGCYGAAFNRIEDRSGAAACRKYLCIDDDGLFASSVLTQGSPRYYRDSIGYYALLLLSSLFPQSRPSISGGNCQRPTSQQEIVTLAAYAQGLAVYRGGASGTPQLPIFSTGSPLAGIVMPYYDDPDERRLLPSCLTGSALDVLEQHACLTGKAPAVAKISMAFSWDGNMIPIPAARLHAAARRGALPYLAWLPVDWAHSDENRYPLAQIIAGRWDNYLREVFRQISVLGFPVILSFANNANAAWQPYGRADFGNTPELMRQATAHLHNIAQAVGARNIVWAYAPAAGQDTSTLSSYFPGDYIRLILPEGTNWGTSHPDWNTQWQSFEELFGPTLDTLRTLYPSIALGIGEMGCMAAGGDQAAWIRQALQAVRDRDLSLANVLI